MILETSVLISSLWVSTGSHTFPQDNTFKDLSTQTDDRLEGRKNSIFLGSFSDQPIQDQHGELSLKALWPRDPCCISWGREWAWTAGLALQLALTTAAPFLLLSLSGREGRVEVRSERKFPMWSQSLCHEWTLPKAWGLSRSPYLSSFSESTGCHNSSHLTLEPFGSCYSGKFWNYNIQSFHFTKEMQLHTNIGLWKGDIDKMSIK